MGTGWGAPFDFTKDLVREERDKINLLGFLAGLGYVIVWVLFALIFSGGSLHDTPKQLEDLRKPRSRPHPKPALFYPFCDVRTHKRGDQDHDH